MLIVLFFCNSNTEMCQICNIFMSHLLHSATVPFPSFDHLKISHIKSQILPWYHIPVKTIWPICSYQYLILFGRDLWHVVFLISRICCWGGDSAPLVQHISESCTHFPTRNDFNSFTFDYRTVSNKYHFIKAMQDNVCVHFPMLYAKWFAQCKMKTSTDGF
jgi:hypothetical protein